MSETNRTRTVFIREGTPLPTTLSIESEAFLPGWRVVKIDRQELTREIERANWNFFYLAGETKTIVFGRARSGTLRRAVKAVLARQEGRKFNALEITRIVSRRFLGVPFTSVTVHSRHIQEGLGLVPAKDFVLRMPAAAQGEAAARQYTAVISTS